MYRFFLTYFTLKQKHLFLLTCITGTISFLYIFATYEDYDSKSYEIFYRETYLIYLFLPLVYLTYALFCRFSPYLEIRFTSSNRLLVVKEVLFMLLSIFLTAIEGVFSLSSVLITQQWNAIFLVFLVVNFLFTFLLFNLFDIFSQLLRHTYLAFILLFTYMLSESNWFFRYSDISLFMEKWIYQELPKASQLFILPNLLLFLGICSLAILGNSYLSAFSRKMPKERR